MFAPSIFFSHGSPMASITISPFQKDFHTSFWSSWSFHTSFLVFQGKISAQACNEAKASNRFTRIVQRKDLPWEKDSIARVAHDPEHIPDCNVQATVGRHFLFHEQIPKAANGSGYLRVATKSLWWQHEHFPKVWTSEGLTTCMENGYQWNINSTTWNHLRMMWQAQPL